MCGTDVRYCVVHQVVMSDNRPALPPLERCPARLATLMRCCWACSPQERPSAQQVAAELSNMMLEMARGGCSTAMLGQQHVMLGQ